MYYGHRNESRSLFFRFAIVLVVFGVIFLIGGLLVYKEYQQAGKPTLHSWNATPAEDLEFGWQMQYKLPQWKMLRKYKLRLSMEMPPKFDAKRYADIHPEEAVYYTDQRPDNGPQWLLIFSDQPPIDPQLKYSWVRNNPSGFRLHR